MSLRRRRPLRRIEVDGLTFAALSDAGSPGIPIVLVHGIGVSHRYLRRLHAALAAHRPVHSIDLPGHGGLPKPGRDVSVPAMARALGEVLAEIGLADAVLVGHSMGTQWVTEVALRRPELVSRVVLMGPVSDERHRTPLAQARALAVDTTRESPRVNAVVFTDYVRCGPRWYLTQLRHMLAYPLEERIARVRQPVLVLRGERDPVAGRAWCHRLVGRAPDARMPEIPAQPHVAQEGDARAVAAQVLAFVPTH